MTTKHLSEKAAAAAHLFAYGIIGSGVLAAVAAPLMLGFATLPLLGFGLLFIGVFAIAIAGIARLEDLRVSGLFGYDIPQRALRKSARTDFWRVPQTLWFQLTDARNWLGLLHFVIITMLGSVAIWITRGAVAASVIALRSGRIASTDITLPPWAGPLLVVGFVALTLLALYGLASAHRGISRMLVPSRVQELEQRAADAADRRDSATHAASVERTRIERDLHDGVQPRLVSVAMTLGMAKGKLESDPTAAAALIDEAHASTKEAISELRQLARGIRPAVLEDRGLDAALSALAGRSPIPVQLDVQLAGRCGERAEAAMYFAVAESLTNAAKHSGASVCRVTILSRAGGMLWGRIEDDGRGGAQILPGGGLDGVSGRVHAAGGTMTVSSPAGGPSTIEVSVPCGS